MKNRKAKSIVATALLSAGIMMGSVLPAHADAGTDGKTGNDRLVSLWYQDFLDRQNGSVGDSSAQYWVDKLDRGESRAAILSQLVQSREFAVVETDAFYRYYLNRSAISDAGADYWFDGIQNDMAPEWVEQNVLASPEFKDKVYSDDAYFVQVLYRDVVGRRLLPSQDEVNYWVNRLNQLGGDRLRLVREMWYTDEAVGNRIQEHYLILLERNRLTRPGEINYWRSSEVVSDLKTRIAFASTPEYESQPNNIY